MPRLVLASGSARRRDYLEQLGVVFEVLPADVDESPQPGESPEALALRLAHEKARAAQQRAPESWVLAADTVVAVGDVVLGKPVDRADARRMLRLLSGRAHRVITGVALLRPDGSAALDTFVVTEVIFRRLADDDIDAYVESGEADDKAGAYGIQGGAGPFVAAVDGSYSNVVGLPLEVVEPALRHARFR
jgi:septum formation protein